MPKAVIILIRLIVYILKVAIIGSLVVGVLAFTFFASRDISNQYVLVSEGMSKRADIALVPDSNESTELYKFFTSKFVENDYVWRGKEYTDYNIKDYNYKISISNIWTWPWDDTGYAIFEERVDNIKGETAAQYDEEGNLIEPKEADEANIPKWKAAKYKAVFVRVDDRWYIGDLEILEELPQTSPRASIDFDKATPMITLTPAPSATPTKKPLYTAKPSKAPKAPTPTPQEE